MREIAWQKPSTGRGPEEQIQKLTPAPTVRAKPVKAAIEMSSRSLVHAPITVRKEHFSFIVIKMLTDVLLTHSTEPHRFYNSSKYLQVVTWVRLSRQK